MRRNLMSAALSLACLAGGYLAGTDSRADRSEPRARAVPEEIHLVWVDDAGTHARTLAVVEYIDGDERVAVAPYPPPGESWRVVVRYGPNAARAGNPVTLNAHATGSSPPAP